MDAQLQDANRQSFRKPKPLLQGHPFAGHLALVPDKQSIFARQPFAFAKVNVTNRGGNPSDHIDFVLAQPGRQGVVAKTPVHDEHVPGNQRVYQLSCQAELTHPQIARGMA